MKMNINTVGWFLVGIFLIWYVFGTNADVLYTKNIKQRYADYKNPLVPGAYHSSIGII